MSDGEASALRLALFTDTFSPQMNGVTRTLERLVDAVRARGGAVRVWTASDPEADADGDVVRMPSVAFWAYPQLRLAAPRVTVTTGELAAFAPTLVHAATPFGVGLSGSGAARSLGVPLVTSYHTSFSAYARFYGLGFLSEGAWPFLRWFHNGGRRTYCPTRAVQRELREHGVRRTRVWPRGVDTARFHPRWRSGELRRALGVGEDGVLVAYVGRLAQEKGLDAAMSAMRIAQERIASDPSAPLVFALAGEGPYAATCRAQAPGGTRFLGRLEGEELSCLYASADLFLFPSTTDTFGNVLLEAMASRLAVVAVDAPPTLELLEDGALGEIAPAGDAEALAHSVLALAGDRARREALAARAHAVASLQSWDAVFDALIGDYLRAAGGPLREQRRRSRRLAAGRATSSEEAVAIRHRAVTASSRR